MKFNAIGDMIGKKAKDTHVKKTPDTVTDECKKELSDQAKQIKKQEQKLRQRLDYDNDRCYYFSIVFNSTEDRNAFLKERGIKLDADTYVIYDKIKNKI